MSNPGESGRDVRDRLRELRVDPPDGGFSASLHRRLLAAGAPRTAGLWRRIWPAANAPRLLWPGLAIAAGLAAIVVVSQLRDHRAGGSRGTVATDVPATKVAVVRVNLSAEVAVESAQIRVSLPEGLVFWADGEALPQRAFEWTQPLRAGDNDIPIAVRGLRPGRYRMTVTARFGDQRVEDEVVLEVVDG